MTDAASARPVGIGELARPAHDIQRRREICETFHPAMPKSCRYHQLRPRSRTLNHPRDSPAIGDSGVAIHAERAERVATGREQLIV